MTDGLDPDVVSAGDKSRYRAGRQCGAGDRNKKTGVVEGSKIFSRSRDFLSRDGFYEYVLEGPERMGVCVSKALVQRGEIPCHKNDVGLTAGSDCSSAD